MSKIIPITSSEWKNVSCYEKQQERTFVNPKTQEIVIKLVSRNVFLYLVGLTLGNKWGETVISTRRISTKSTHENEVKAPPEKSSLPEIKAKIPSPIHQPPKAISPYEEMIQNLDVIWKEDSHEKHVFVETWKVMTAGETLKKWQRVSETSEHVVFDLEFERDAHGAHTWAPGKVYIKNSMTVHFSKQNGQKLIHFPKPGFVHRFPFLDFPLNSIELHQGNVKIKYGLFGFERNLQCPVETALKFWKDITWHKPVNEKKI